MSSNHYITCEELVSFVLDYVDGLLPPSQRTEFDRHLSVCPSCVAYLDGYRTSLQLAREAFGAQPELSDQSLPESLKAAIRAARTKS
ncbi:MAG: zf-HC2 domain-containing protein [Planctomycetota bacterium]|nr:zf-HC2 domain-containing protein [Planctomycetota bacterium]